MEFVSQTTPFYGTTPLHMAARRCPDAEIIKMLKGLGADVNALELHRMTPLHEAALRGHAQAVRALLQLGADHKRLSRRGQTALDCAREPKGRTLGHIECEERLLGRLTADAADTAKDWATLASGATVQAWDAAGNKATPTLVAGAKLLVQSGGIQLIDGEHSYGNESILLRRLESG